MNMTRKDFLKTSAAFAAVVGLDPAALAGANAENPFKAVDYAALRQELAKFYPAGFCRGKCQSEPVLASFRAILAGLDAWAKDNPGYDALDARCAYYRLVQKHFQPVLFKESPFYFEAGVNGGWSGANGGGIEANPAFRVKQLCEHLAKGPGRIPESAFQLMGDRGRENLLLCCGTFVDEMHNIPPFRTILQKGSHLLQPNCNSVEELRDAQKHPERHRNLMVRVCGFSARFVGLSRRWQDEVIARNRLK